MFCQALFYSGNVLAKIEPSAPSYEKFKAMRDDATISSCLKKKKKEFTVLRVLHFLIQKSYVAYSSNYGYTTDYSFKEKNREMNASPPLFFQQWHAFSWVKCTL